MKDGVKKIGKALFYSRRQRPRVLARMLLLDPFQLWCHKFISAFVARDDIVLDVGSRDFPFTIYQPVKIVFGIDLMSESDGYLGWGERSLRRIREQMNVLPYVANAEEMPFADASFDKVILIEVIEHIENDDRAVREISRVLKPSGKVLLTTPNGDEVPNTHIYHVRHYTPETFRALLATSFNNVTIWKIMPGKRINELPWLAGRSKLATYFFIYVHKAYQALVGRFVRNQGYHLAALCESPRYKHVSFPESLSDIVVCPETHEPLEERDGSLFSKKSNKRYDKIHGVPVLLTRTPHHQNTELLEKNEKRRN